MHLKTMKQEFVWLVLLAVAGLIGFKIVFYNESLLVLLRAIAALVWLFVLPGFLLMYYWHDKLAFTERLVAGIFVSAVLVGIPSYYLGLLGLHIAYHGIALPLAIIAFGIVLIHKAEKGH